MPIKVLELHHHGIRIGKSAEDVSKAQEFYTDLLGLQADQGRPISLAFLASGSMSGMTRTPRKST